MTVLSLELLPVWLPDSCPGAGGWRCEPSSNRRRLLLLNGLVLTDDRDDDMDVFGFGFETPGWLDGSRGLFGVWLVMSDRTPLLLPFPLLLPLPLFCDSHRTEEEEDPRTDGCVWASGRLTAGTSSSSFSLDCWRSGCCVW
jgi:hypothetical protein